MIFFYHGFTKKKLLKFISCTRLEGLASNRLNWRNTVKTGIARAESDRIKRLIEKREKRKARTDLARLPT